MTDPVDTDALRAKVNLDADSDAEFGRKVIILQRAALRAADEVDRLRRELAWTTEHAAQRAAAYETARAVIGNAPHANGCDMTWTEANRKPSDFCTCWKADAL